MITAFVVAMTLNGVTAFTPARDFSVPSVYYEGAWQSCPDEDDGSYGEGILPYVWHGVTIWEFHLGPRSEFALFTGTSEEHLDHASKANKLGPAYDYDDVKPLVGGRNWTIPSLNVRINVVAVPGSYPECRSFFVRVERDRPLRSVAR